jgi:hypothetical protein
VEEVNEGRRPNSAQRMTSDSLSRLATLFPFQEAVGVLDRRKSLSLTQRAGTLGPLTVLDLAFDVDTWIRCADERPYYYVTVLAAGQMELLHRGSLIASARVWQTFACPRVSSLCLGGEPVVE